MKFNRGWLFTCNRFSACCRKTLIDVSICMNGYHNESLHDYIVYRVWSFRCKFTQLLRKRKRLDLTESALQRYYPITCLTNQITRFKQGHDGIGNTLRAHNSRTTQKQCIVPSQKCHWNLSKNWISCLVQDFIFFSLMISIYKSFVNQESKTNLSAMVKEFLSFN
jgi:hypothetical protein